MEITLPRIETLEETGTNGKFVVEPLERGYGVTLANSLRRVMLSSIEGAAVTYVKIEKVLHEFSTIPGLKEDTSELLLNLKALYVKVDPNGTEPAEPTTIRIARRGEGRITGADVECPDGVEVVNPDVYLATISDEDASLEMEMTVEVGKGYVLPDKQERRALQPIGVIPVGSAFTPVRKVNYTVEATRVGFKTDFERLVLEITTNGTIKPSEAISQGAAILDRYFRYFMEFGGVSTAVDADPALLPETQAGIEAPDARIEELDFGVRTYNCLKKANILTIAELVQTTETDLMQIRNFGKKSLLEVREKLSQWGLSLKGGSTVSTDDVEAEVAEGPEDE
ncbi:MAG: DNA-directed RNA polymerase subunit alpha [Chthonomonadales bacterium]|nr:DNA-directed RNA polymerase subunit alpha [Chthonomonadales bacterium]